jgi:hypothetical protein
MYSSERQSFRTSEWNAPEPVPNTIQKREIIILGDKVADEKTVLRTKIDFLNSFIEDLQKNIKPKIKSGRWFCQRPDCCLSIFVFVKEEIFF